MKAHLALRIAAAPALLLLVLYPLLITLLHPFRGEVSQLKGGPNVLQLRCEKSAAGSVRGRRKLVSGGTPTGGGKYPFLTLIDYRNDSRKGSDAFRPVRTSTKHCDGPC